jgi:hypothetical protein
MQLLFWLFEESPDTVAADQGFLSSGKPSPAQPLDSSRRWATPV